jgi:NADH-quinone oxidoreductase subunit C
MADLEREQRRAELLEAAGLRFDLEPRAATDGSVWISVEEQRLGDLLAFLKREGFVHCSAISVTDWPEEGVFELTYHLWSYDDRILLTVKSRIDRTKATISSAFPLWGESAAIHERELHELFGVWFEGNPDLTPLFLDQWDGPPPFRKDFDWRAYVREAFYEEGDPRERSYWD